MTDSTDRAQTVFLNALEIGSEAACEAYLEAECRDDQALRLEVEGLLNHARRLGNFLEPAEGDGAPEVGPTRDVAISERAGSQIGPYKLREQVGEGGMGIVYVAEQERPVRRKVALKIVKPGMDTKGVIARFEAERQALAMMDHPNIAKVLDAGSTERGRPFFVMDLVRGVPITDYCDKQKLTTGERLELFVTVCEAVQHAHQKGIIHRDIKPSNVLVTRNGDRAVPKVIDFGVAKATNQRLTERTIYTHLNQMVGTPLYMSPEQAEMSELDVDTRSDIYSLGVLLYELLTGTTPFERETLSSVGYDEMRRIIRDDEPPRPSERVSTLAAETLSTMMERRRGESGALRQTLRGELDWIVVKAIEKDRSRRYESASAFAADVERYLNDQPVEACPPSIGYRISKFGRRNKLAVLSTALIACMLIVGTGISVWLALDANAAREVANRRFGEVQEQKKTADENLVMARAAEQRAESARAEEAAARRETARQLYYADMRLGLTDWEVGNSSRLFANLNRHLPGDKVDDQRGWEWFYLLSLGRQEATTLLDYWGQVQALAWSPDGRYLAANNEGVTIWDTRTWAVAHRLQGGCRGLAWSPDASKLAFGKFLGGGSHVAVWDRRSARVISLPAEHESSVYALAWHPDGRRLASGGRDTAVRIWDFAAAAYVQKLEGFPLPHVRCIAWNPSGDEIAAVGTYDGVAIWDLASGNETIVSADSLVDLMSVSWSPDGELLFVANSDGALNWIDASTREVRREVQGHHSAARCAVGPNGNLVATAGDDGKVKVWDITTGRATLEQRGHREGVFAVCWSPDGSRLAAGGQDHVVRIWDAAAKPFPASLHVNTGPITSLNWIDDNRLGYTDDTTGVAAIWDIATGEQSTMYQAVGAVGLGWSPDSRSLAIETQQDDGMLLRIVDIGTTENQGTPQWKVDLVQFGEGPTGLAWSPGNRFLARWEPWRLFQVWDTHSKQTITEAIIENGANWSESMDATTRSVAWDQTGRYLALVGRGFMGGQTDELGRLTVIDTETGARLWESGLSDDGTAVAWSHDGQRLVAGAANGEVHVFESQSGQLLRHDSFHSSSITNLDWAPDGRRIASASSDHSVKIVDSETVEELLALRTHTGPVIAVRWNPDGRALATAGQDGTIRVWDASPGYEYAASPTYRRERVKAQVVAHLDRAKLAQQGNRPEEALRELSQAIALDPTSPENWQTRAQFHASAGNWEKFIEDISEAIRIAPKNAESWNMRGIAFANTGELNQAVDDYTRSLTISPGAHVHLNRAGANAQLGEWAQCQRDLEGAIKLRPNDASTWYASAMMCLQVHEGQDYQRVCERMLAQFRATSDAQTARRVAWTCALRPNAVGDIDACVDLAQAALASSPRDQSLVKAVAAILYRAGEYDQAKLRYQELENLRSEQAEAARSSPAYDWFFRAMTHQQLGEFAAAEEWLTKAVEQAESEMAEQDCRWNRRLTLELLRDEATPLIRAAETNQ